MSRYYLTSHNNTLLICNTYLGSAYHYPVCLYNNGRISDYEGTVEVFISSTNTWGLICDYQWDLHDANVVCRMLGYVGNKSFSVSVSVSVCLSVCLSLSLSLSQIYIYYITMFIDIIF